MKAKWRTSGSSSRCTTGYVSSQEPSVPVFPLTSKYGLEIILECEIESLGREISNDVGSVSSPKGFQTFLALTDSVHDLLLYLDLLVACWTPRGERTHVDLGLDTSAACSQGKDGAQETDDSLKVLTMPLYSSGLIWTRSLTLSCTWSFSFDMDKREGGGGRHLQLEQRQFWRWTPPHHP